MDKPRYIVVDAAEAAERKLPGWETLGDLNGNCVYLCDPDGKPEHLAGTDICEPEDKTFVRDLRWVVDLLNKLVDQETNVG